MTPSPVVAIVLGGGRSSRFGSDKLAALVDGEPLLHLAIRAGAEIADLVLVAVGPGSDPDLPAASSLRPGASVEVVRDPERFGGPLVAVAWASRAAVTHPLVAGTAGEAVALVVGGDMPHLHPAVLRAMVDVLRPDGAFDAAILEGEDRPRPLPLAARLGPLATAAQDEMAGEKRSLRGALARLRVAVVPAREWRVLDPAGATLRDIDRPDDLGAPSLGAP